MPFCCRASLVPGQGPDIPVVKAACTALTRSYNALQGSPVIIKLFPAVGIIVLSVFGLEPLIRQIRTLFRNKEENNWRRSRTYNIMTTYIQPLMLWTGAILICRALEPIALPTEPSRVVKKRLLNFIGSLSTVLAFGYCLSRVIQEAQKYFMETSDSTDTRNMGYQFAGKAVYSAVWVAAVSLFMELLGFSTQKWLTAGGLGTVLPTLVGREIFTNFLSSVMIQATRPFILNEWIQTKIEGYEVSGTVEIIVADMRKVLAKNPQVEQQRLHRRVFLDNVDTENQALLIMVSCFVKTSHHEEYLRVKEIILLDLLRAISHHGARLATPIRTVQKMYSDTDYDSVPFVDSFFHRGGVKSNSPLLLIEPHYKINGEDKTKSQSLHTRSSGEQESKSTKADSKVEETQKSDSNAKERSSLDAKKKAKIGETPNSLEIKEDLKNDDISEISPLKQDGARSSSPQSSTSRAALEENIVLGVALEGSKRTLPIEDGIDLPTVTEAKELAGVRGNQNGPQTKKKNRKDRTRTL